MAPNELAKSGDKNANAAQITNVHIETNLTKPNLSTNNPNGKVVIETPTKLAPTNRLCSNVSYLYRGPYWRGTQITN